MNRSIFVDAGERTSLLPKTLTYGFSLDFRLRLDSTDHKPPGPMLLYAPAEKPATFHVTDKDFITTTDGALREVPTARLKKAEDFLPITKDVANLDGRLLFMTDTNNPLVMTYSGVLNIPGGTSRWLDRKKPIRPATAFIYSRQDYQGAKYRSLVWNQLIGVGSFVPGYDKKQGVLFDVQLDFYIPS